MVISRRNIFIAVILIISGLLSAGYGIIKASSSNQIVVEAGESIKKDNANLIEEDKSADNSQNTEIFIHVIGSVKKPGLVRLPIGSRISDALQAAGGANADADLEMVNMAYKLEDGQQIYIPDKAKQKGTKTLEGNNGRMSANKTTDNQKKPASGVNADSSGVKTVSNTSGGVKTDQLNQTSSSKGCVNINTAGVTELDSLPGIGALTAQKIIDYRNTNGKFRVPEDIMKVKGIGKAKYEKLKNRISI